VVKSWDWDQYCRAVFTIIKTYRHSLQGRWHLAFEKNCINLKCYLSFQENTSFSAHWYLRNLYHHILQTCFLFCAVSFSSKIITQHRSIHGFLSFFQKELKKKKPISNRNIWLQNRFVFRFFFFLWRNHCCR
jgi:hypothetical protein